MAMDELAKANHSIMKLGGDAVAREAIMKVLEEELAKYKEWATKSTDRVSELERVRNKQRTQIAQLNKAVDEGAKQLEASSAEINALKVQLVEAKSKGEHDVVMAVRRHRRSTAFRRESDSNYLAGLNECRVAIMQRYPELNFEFIAKATQTKPDPNFQGDEGTIAPLVPIDDAYEATIDTEASNKKEEKEAGEEVDQPVSGEVPTGDAEGEAPV